MTISVRPLARWQNRMLTAAAVLSVAPAAWADGTDEPAADSRLEELVVTARKRPEPLREVPTSVTVLQAETLATLGASDMGDVELRLPNFASNFSPLTEFTARYVRGLNAGARNIGFDSGYGVFVDGVYSGRYASAARLLQDVERIEYLPGPQGTLFGKNTTLGVVNIVTRTPDPVAGAALAVDMGSQGHRATRATATLPLTESWTASASAGREVRDGLVDNSYLGSDGNEVDQWDARLALHGEVAGWSATLAADYFERTPDIIARQRLGGLGALPPREARNDLAESVEDEDQGISLILERDFAMGTLTSISAYRDASTLANVDDDAWEVPVQHLIDWEESTRQISQELRLNGDRGRFSYLVGGYFLDQEAESSRTVASMFGQLRADGELEGRTWALFSTLGYTLTPRLDAELGVRWTRESKDLPAYTQNGGGFLIDVAVEDQRSVTSVTPSASLSYALTNQASVYARYAQGFKSGGFNVDLVTSAALGEVEFDDEQVDTVEAGMKSVWLDGRLRLDLAAFYSDYQDLQVSQYVVLPGALLPTLQISNAASAHTLGGELGAELLLGRWLWAAQVGYTHGEVDDFPDPLGPGSGNYAGNSLGGPEWTSSLRAQYTRSLGATELTLTAEHLFQDRTGGDLSGDPLAVSDSLSLVNLRAELSFGSERRWTVRAWMDNVFDTDRVVERRAHAAPGLMMLLLGYPPEIAQSTVGLYNAPRTYGLEIHLAL